MKVNATMENGFHRTHKGKETRPNEETWPEVTFPQC